MNSCLVTDAYHRRETFCQPGSIPGGLFHWAFSCKNKLTSLEPKAHKYASSTCNRGPTDLGFYWVKMGPRRFTWAPKYIHKLPINRPSRCYVNHCLLDMHRAATDSCHSATTHHAYPRDPKASQSAGSTRIQIRLEVEVRVRNTNTNTKVKLS